MYHVPEDEREPDQKDEGREAAGEDQAPVERVNAPLAVESAFRLGQRRLSLWPNYWPRWVQVPELLFRQKQKKRMKKRYRTT